MKFRQAKATDTDEIWKIIQYAIDSRKRDGSSQWQDGYPNYETIKSDISQKYAFVIEEEQILIYGAIQFSPEPTYEKINGAWISDLPYGVIHRMAVSPNAKGKGMAIKFISAAELYVLNNGYKSLRIDTHNDNFAMLHIIKKLGYNHCGQISVRGESREAFEKILNNNI